LLLSSSALDLQKSDWQRRVEMLMKEGILRSPNVINTMRSVPREEFLPENMRPYSSEDTPLPIGFGQTASAPHGIGNSAAPGETWSQS
jgi:protein-L-isoaspartate O-methyltransferase